MILSFAPEGAGAGAMGWLLGVPSAMAFLTYLGAGTLGGRDGAALKSVLVLGWLAHALAIVLDVAGIGEETLGARFGFAPVMSLTVWLVLAVYGIESRVVPLPSVRRSLALVGAATVALAWVFPGEFRPHNLSRWAPLHWVLGIASYGLFGAAVLHGAMLSRAERQLRRLPSGAAGGGIPLLRLERLTFRFVAAGFIVLSAALLLGAWFANPWRWDHKTVFSLLGWAVFAALLAGRQAFGWRGPRATRWLYAGAALLLLAYVGSRFVLEVLLQRAA